MLHCYAIIKIILVTLRPLLKDTSFPVTRRWDHENIVGGRGKSFYEQNHFTNFMNRWGRNLEHFTTVNLNVKPN